MLHVEERGTGPALVILHGSPSTPEHLRPLARRLSARFRTLLVHLPGYGFSPPLFPYDLQKSHEQIERSLIRRQVRDAHLLGHAGGAYRAVALAGRGAIRPLSIAALSTAMHTPPEARALLLEIARLLRGRIDVAPMFPELMLSERWRTNPVWSDHVSSWATASDPYHLASELEALAAAPDLRPLVADLDVPMLLRVGSADSASPAVYSEEVARLARRPTLQIVPGAGHALLTEDFAPTSAAVAAFLDAVV